MTPTRRFEALAALVVLALCGAIGLVIALGEPRPLTIVDARPGDGAAGVSVTTQVMVVFSRPVDEASVRAALSVEPQTEGFVSAAGRRAAFTPRTGFRAETDYAVTLGTGVRDRAGRSLPRPITIRFRTRGQALVVRTADGRLLRATLDGSAEPLAGPGVGEFATSAAGDLAYVLPAEGVLVVTPAGPAPGGTRRIALPKAGGPEFGVYGTATRAVEIHDLTWAPGGAVLGFLAPRRDGVILAYLVHLTEAMPTVEPFGPPPRPIPGEFIVEALKKSLVEIVYRRETFAFTPDGRGVIVRDMNWDYAVFGFDGSRRGTFGPFLAVGNVSPRGDFVAFVDVNPADPTLKRLVIAYERAGRLRSLSPPDRDSYSPRFAHHSDRVVFATGPAIGTPGERHFALELVDLATGARRRLTHPPAGESDEGQRWAPDDTWIAFRRAPAGAPERGGVWVVPADGGTARPLASAATDARWSP